MELEPRSVTCKWTLSITGIGLTEIFISQTNCFTFSQQMVLRHWLEILSLNLRLVLTENINFLSDLTDFIEYSVIVVYCNIRFDVQKTSLGCECGIILF